MRYAVISDVHANLEALNSVLKKITEEAVDELFFLGDIVGYGPNPNECIEALKEKTNILLAGNHDWASVGMTDVEYFNPYARAAVEWTQKVLRDENIAFLRKLPLTEGLDNSIFLVHATPREPEQWHYLTTTRDADINFRFFKERLCFIGHSHEPAIIGLSPVGIDLPTDKAGSYREEKITFFKERAEIKEGHRYIVNAGSVGQPRDGNPYASYALLNKNSIEIKRVSYDIVSTQKKMRDAGLPEYLINRLSWGR